MSTQYKPASIRELIHLIIRRIRTIVILPVIIAIIAAVATLFMDNVYKSSASLLPAQDRTVGLESLLGGRIGGLAGSLIGGGRSAPFDRYLVLLNSESVKMQVIETFNLMEVYETADKKYPITRTIKELENNTNFIGQVEGNFVIEVWDTDPERARNMVAFYINLLNDFNNELRNTEATAYRRFIQQRYDRAFAEVDSLRQALADFQRRYGIFELPEQVRAYFTLIGQITAEKVQAEIAADVVAATVGTESNAYRQAQVRLQTIDRNLERAYARSEGNPLFLDLESLPEIGTEYFELLQNVELQTEILKFVVPLYEQALLEEQKLLPTVTVVDAPRVAEKKDKPFRALIVLVVLISSFLVITSVLVLQYTYEKNRGFLRSFLTDESHQPQ